MRVTPLLANRFVNTEKCKIFYWTENEDWTCKRGNNSCGHGCSLSISTQFHRGSQRENAKVFAQSIHRKSESHNHFHNEKTRIERWKRDEEIDNDNIFEENFLTRGEVRWKEGNIPEPAAEIVAVVIATGLAITGLAVAILKKIRTFSFLRPPSKLHHHGSFVLNISWIFRNREKKRTDNDSFDRTNGGMDKREIRGLNRENDSAAVQLSKLWWLGRELGKSALWSNY